MELPIDPDRFTISRQCQETRQLRTEEEPFIIDTIARQLNSLGTLVSRLENLGQKNDSLLGILDFLEQLDRLSPERTN